MDEEHEKPEASRGKQTYRIWGVGRLDTLAFEEKPDRLDGLTLAFAEGSHQLLQLGASFDLEEDLVVVVGHLDVEVLAATLGDIGALARGTVLRSVGHCEFLRGVGCRR